MQLYTRQPPLVLPVPPPPKPKTLYPLSHPLYTHTHTFYTKLPHTKRCKDRVTYSLLPPSKPAGLLCVGAGSLVFERCTHSAWRSGDGVMRSLCCWSVKTRPDLGISKCTECIILWHVDHTRRFFSNPNCTLQDSHLISSHIEQALIVTSTLFTFLLLSSQLKPR